MARRAGTFPFAWSVLGAAAAATRHIGLMTAVTCPTMRYHPAIVAQAAATMALLRDNRFVLGLGSGERLNEHVIGAGWPGIRERQRRLAEALDILEGLLADPLTHYDGQYYRLDHAELFDRTDQPPAVILAAAGPEAAQLAAEKADGLITTEPSRGIGAAYGAAGGSGPRYAEVTLCYAASEEKARQVAHRYHRWALAGGQVLPELPHTKAFAAASVHITPEMVAEKVTCGPDPACHLQAIRRYRDAGYDHLILMQVGPEQEAFCAFFERQLAAQLRD